jgi:hypothetical protein
LVVVDERVVSVVESSFYLHNVESRFADVNIFVLRIFNTQFSSVAVINCVPASSHLLEVASILPNRNANLVVIEHHPIQMEEVNKMLAKINFVSSILPVSSL